MILAGDRFSTLLVLHRCDWHSDPRSIVRRHSRCCVPNSLGCCGVCRYPHRCLISPNSNGSVSHYNDGECIRCGDWWDQWNQWDESLTVASVSPSQRVLAVAFKLVSFTLGTCHQHFSRLYAAHGPCVSPHSYVVVEFLFVRKLASHLCYGMAILLCIYHNMFSLVDLPQVWACIRIVRMPSSNHASSSPCDVGTFSRFVSRFVSRSVFHHLCGQVVTISVATRLTELVGQAAKAQRWRCPECSVK